MRVLKALQLLDGSGFDERTRTARLGAGLLLCDGVVLVVTMGLLPSGIARRPLALVGLLAIGLGGMALLLPWSRLHRRAPSALALVQVALFAIGGVSDYGGLRFYTGLLAVAFIFTGLTQPRGASLLLLPCAAVAYMIVHNGTGGWAVRLLILVPVWLLTSELLAAALERQRRAHAHLSQLLDATRQLAAATDEATAADLTASLAAGLLGGDMVEVMVAEAPGSSRYINRGQHQSPLARNSVVLDTVDPNGVASDVQQVIQHAQTLTVADTATSELALPTLVRDSGARSAVLVPLPGYLGVIAVVWRTPRPELQAGLDSFTANAATLLAAEAARALERTRATAELAHKAETDPLTGLANRHTYQRALAGLMPCDAVILIDLDHFKQVNDTHGHATGDQVLANFAAHLRAAVPRRGDCVARCGGEEFALILAGANIAGAARVLERLQTEWLLTDPLTTFSAGIAVHRPGMYAAVTIAEADEALYRAKAAGRARWVAAEQPVLQDIAIGQPTSPTSTGPAHPPRN